MGKPKAPKAPDYAAAATAQGTANTQSAIASNFLNQADQVGPYGSLKYSYDNATGLTQADGTVIPHTTATTTLSPEQQKLLDQEIGISTQLNDLASRGIGYVDQASATPIDQSRLPGRGRLADEGNGVALRDKITDAMMERMRPYIEKDREALKTQMANQGLGNGTEARAWEEDKFQRGVNDQRIAAMLAGDQEQQNVFNRGLATGQFDNANRGQAIQEEDYFKNQPLNMLNALRSGNQVTLPQFGNVSAGNSAAPAPVYAAAQDQYSAALDAYKQKMANFGAIVGAVGGLGSAGITKFSDRRLKAKIEKVGELADGLGVYEYQYLWSDEFELGVMADEVEALRPWAVGPMVQGFATVNYGAL